MTTERPEPSRAPRSLADWLRGVPDADLVALLTERPDLVHPVPPDLVVLSTRATARPSVLAALDHLDVFALEVIDALAALPDPASYDDLVAAVGPDVEMAVRATVDRLRRLALVWGDDEGLHLIRTVREVVPDPAGLGPALATAVSGTSTGRLRDILAALGLDPTPDRFSAVETLAAWCRVNPGAVIEVANGGPAGASELLTRLAWGAPVAAVADLRDAGTTGADDLDEPDDRSTLGYLLAHGLVVAVDDRHVVVPREVAIAVRGGRLLDRTHPIPPPVNAQPVDADRSAHTAAAHATDAVRLVDELLDSWANDPPAALRSGGIGVRDVRRTAQRLDRTEDDTAVLVETAYAAGLLGRSVGEWLPTPAYDVWRTADDPDRWAALAHAWLTMSRVPGLAATRDERDRPLGLLSPELDRTLAPMVRLATLRVLAELPPDATAAADDVHERIQWSTPRRGGRLRHDLVEWTLAEAELLGITGAHALPSSGRALIDGDSDAAAHALTSLAPDPIDHILIQADMTAIAPGPLTRDLAREIGMLADVESTGHATVYRFSEASVRRGLDSGRTPAEIHDFLAAHSRTPIPQPLTYLVDDLARRHGRIRVGTASAYIRCDEPAILDELVSARGAAGLRLRRLAPTVAATEAAPDRVLDVLRDLGHAPAAESGEGDVVIAAPVGKRARDAAPPMPVTEPRAPRREVLDAAVHTLRAGDRASTVARKPVEPAEPPSGVMPSTPSARTLVALQEAALEGTSIWIGYVNAQGRATQRIVEPISVDGGYLRAFDHLRDEVRTFAIHRITGVAELVEEDA